MFSKLQITGEIEIKTGLHIGGNNAYSAIGAVDSPVVRDPQTKKPVIPGSSLKGKMRTLLARSRSNNYILESCNKDEPEILRLFGGSERDEKTGRIPNSRLKFSDCFITNDKKLKEQDIAPTEVKFENTINRITAEAMPRQIERVIRGALFDFELIYDVDIESEAVSDFQTLKEGFDLLEYDYLGGHGSRGSGRVKFNKLEVKCVYGGKDNLAADCQKILNP